MAAPTAPPPIATGTTAMQEDGGGVLSASLLSPRAAGLAPTLDSIIAATPRCHLTPFSFFVSWQGVLTLAYRGFPPALVRLKADLASHHPALPHENPGSRWPKTSLAALKDGARLTPEQLTTLNTLCAQESALFAYEGDRASIEVGHASIILFECRSLERALSIRDVPFNSALPVDPAPPAPEEHARVTGILAESTAPDYWFAASKDGNREGHYRNDHLGVTLVFRHRMRDGGGGSGGGGTGWNGTCAGASTTSPSAPPAPSGLARLQRVIDDFQAKVEAALPGMYAWFAPESRHVTLRGILG